MKNGKVAIIGAGFAGLTIALELIKNKIPFDIYESEKVAGGLASSFKIGDTYLEKYYHHFFVNDSYLIDLIKELGMEKEIVWSNPKISTLYKDTKYNFASPLDLLKFSPIPFWQRIRFGLLLATVSISNNWKTLDSITAKDWLIKHSGKDTYRVLWKPLMDSKFGEYSDQVSASWLWGRLKIRASSRDKSGKEMLGYIRDGGFARIINKMVDLVVRSKNNIFLDTPVIKICKNNDLIEIESKIGTQKYDKTIFTAAPSMLKSVVKNLPQEYCERIDKIKFQANICLVLVLDKPISDIYWLNINNPESPFVAYLEHTNFVDRRNYGNKTIVYISRYLSPDSPLYSMNKHQIEKIFMQYLSKIFPVILERKVLSSYLFKDRNSQPAPLTDFSSDILEYETPIKNLYIANISQIYPEDRGMNFSIRMGKEVAEIIGK